MWVKLMNKTVLHTVSVSLCVAIVILFFILRGGQETVAPVAPVDPVKPAESTRALGHYYKRHVSYGLTLKSNKEKPLAKAEIWVYAPANEDPEFLFSTSHPASLERDEMGNRIIHFVFENLPPFATKIINIDVELNLQSPPRKQQLLDPDLFLEAEPLVQIENPEVIALAGQLQGEAPVQTLNNIYNWVTDSLEKSSYRARERGAIYALRKKKGDCTEFMQLSLALCRINKIPARGVSGYVITQNTRLSPNEFHDWVEVYLNGAWQIFDPFNRVLMEKEEDYLVMRYHNPRKKDGFPRWKTSDPQLKATMTD